MGTHRLLIPLIASLLGAQPVLGNEMDRYLTPAFVAELAEFLRLPNDARDRAALAPNLAWLEAAFTRRGFRVQDLSDPDYALMFAERPVPAPARTVLFYFHFDGQPVDPAQWRQSSPYEPVLKVPTAEGGFATVPWTTRVSDPDTRLYARSASDDKGPIVMLLHALDQLAERGFGRRDAYKGHSGRQGGARFARTGPENCPRPRPARRGLPAGRGRAGTLH